MLLSVLGVLEIESSYRYEVPNGFLLITNYVRWRGNELGRTVDS